MPCNRVERGRWRRENPERWREIVRAAVHRYQERHPDRIRRQVARYKRRHHRLVIIRRRLWRWRPDMGVPDYACVEDTMLFQFNSLYFGFPASAAHYGRIADVLAAHGRFREAVR